MLRIEKTEFEMKYTEINIRQRLYKGNSYITLLLNTEFFPALVGTSIVSGAIEAKIDINGIKSLDDLVDKNYEGDIGSVTVSVNNNGIWEHQNASKFKVKFGKRNSRRIEILLETENTKLETSAVISSLYTTSSNEDELKRNFDFSDFYDIKQVKEIGNSKVIKYFVKEQ